MKKSIKFAVCVVAASLAFSANAKARPYSTEVSDIGYGFLKMVRYGVSAGVKKIEIDYTDGGDFKKVTFELQTPIDKNAWKTIFTNYAKKKSTLVKWEQCIAAEVKGYDATLFCIHTNNDDVIGYGLKAGGKSGQIDQTAAPDEVKKKLLKQKQSAR